MTWRKVEFPQFLLKSQKQKHVSSLSTLQSIILRPSLHDGTLNLLRIQMFNVKTFSSREHKTTKQKRKNHNNKQLKTTKQKQTKKKTNKK